MLDENWKPLKVDEKEVVHTNLADATACLSYVCLSDSVEQYKNRESTNTTSAMSC